MAREMTTPEAISQYFLQTGIRTDQVDPGTFEVPTDQANPHGTPDTVHGDIANILQWNGVRLTDDTGEHGRFSRNFVLQVGIVLGAALYRDGLLPEDLGRAVTAVGRPEGSSMPKMRIGDIT